MQPPIRCPMKNNNKGFSLVEILVTLMLTTTSILGMVALQSNAVRYTQDSINRNNAVSLANDLIEIMRQYPEDLWEHGYQRYDRLQTSTPLYNSSGSLVVAASSCVNNPQSLAQQAACWLQRVENTLPGAKSDNIKNNIRICPSFKLESGAISCASSSYMGSSMAIQLAWQARPGECMEGDVNSFQCTHQMRFEL